MNPATMRRQTGFTLIEAMIAVACMALLLTAVLQVFRQGSQSSLRGMLQVETTLEAQAIIRQVTQDLESLCVEAEDGAADLSTRALTVSGTAPNLTITFLAFPLHGAIDGVVPVASSGQGYTLANRITYTVSGNPTPEKPYLQLSRREHLHPRHPDAGSGGGSTEKVLSQRVHVFQIVPRRFGAANRQLDCFWINLQLVDSLHRATLVPRRLGEQLFGPPPNALIADFFGIAWPRFIRGIETNDGFNLNWYAGVSAP